MRPAGQLPLWLRHGTALVLLANLAVMVAAFELAFALRFDFALPARYAAVMLRLLPFALLCKLVSFAALGLFRGWWRHVSVRDAEDLVRGNVLGSTLFLVAVVFAHGLAGFPRSIFILDPVLCLVLQAALRLTIPLLQARRARAGARGVQKLMMIVGAGSAGIHLLQEIESRRELGIGVVGFVDDDPAKQGFLVCGAPVLGTVDELPALVVQHVVGEVLIAIPSASGARLRRIIERCEEVRVRHRVLPTVGELALGSVTYSQTREVKVDDFLAREPARFDLLRVRTLLADERVLVTGAAGSVGAELCRQIAHHEPRILVLHDRSENGVFLLELELRMRFPGLRVVPVLGDLLLQGDLGHVFAAHRPGVVFHAAAYKHIGMVERNPLEAVRNNVLGTRNVLETAIAHGARDFVLVSTDKAVAPTSLVGASKRAAELVVRERGDPSCRAVVVRFGNVLESNGSVVPLFRQQIARGGPVTVTDPEATRYFMTIPEAAQLILQAAGLGNGGEIFILDMGEPVRIVDLARQMIRLSGKQPDEDITIMFTGLRPGEKLHEEHMSESERASATHLDRWSIVPPGDSPTWPMIWLPRLERCLAAGDVAGVLRLLCTVVPDYQPSSLITEMQAARDDGSRQDAGRTLRPSRG